MIQAIIEYDLIYKSPTLYDLGEPLLKKEVVKIKEYLQVHMDTWKRTGFTIMTSLCFQGQIRRAGALRTCLYSMN